MFLVFNSGRCLLLPANTNIWTSNTTLMHSANNHQVEPIPVQKHRSFV